MINSMQAIFVGLCIGLFVGQCEHTISLCSHQPITTSLSESNRLDGSAHILRTQIENTQRIHLYLI